MTLEKMTALVGAMNEALLRLQPEDEGSVVIAGGAVRDALMGKPIRDLDILIDVIPSSHLLEAFDRILGVNLVEYTGDFDEEKVRTLDADYAKDTDRKSFLAELYKGEGVDLIVTTGTVAEHIKDFPDNISRAWIDTDGVHTAPEFDTGHRDKVIEYRATAGAGRLNKLKAKFPDYSVIEFYKYEATAAR